MTDMVFDINPIGGATGLHFDEFDLGFLGDKKIGRASEILFNEDTQLWDIWVPGADDASVSGFSAYDKAREFEVLWLQECRKQGLDPLSLEGEAIIYALIAGV